MCVCAPPPPGERLHVSLSSGQRAGSQLDSTTLDVAFAHLALDVLWSTLIGFLLCESSVWESLGIPVEGFAVARFPDVCQAWYVTSPE